MTRKYESTEVRQRQIVDAARKVIIKYGSEHVTVKRIAKEVGLSETAIYRHFKSKRDILFLLVEYIEQSLIEDVTKAAAENRKPLECLNDALGNHLSAVEKRRGIYFQVIAEIISLGDKKLNGKVAHAINNYIAFIKKILIEGVNCGEIRADLDLDTAAMAFFGIIQGFVNIWALNGYSYDPKEKYTALWNIFREAIIKR